MPSGLLQFSEPCLIGLVMLPKPVIEPPWLVAWLLSGLVCHRGLARCQGHFRSAQRAIVDLQVVQGASLKPLPHRAASCRAYCHHRRCPVRIAFDLHFHGLSIEVKAIPEARLDPSYVHPSVNHCSMGSLSRVLILMALPGQKWIKAKKHAHPREAIHSHGYLHPILPWSDASR